MLRVNKVEIKNIYLNINRLIKSETMSAQPLSVTF